MSIKSAKAFIEYVKNDEDCRKELEEMRSAEERMRFAKARGFDFTEDEIAELQDRLTLDELDAVAGGWVGDTFLCGQPG